MHGRAGRVLAGGGVGGAGGLYGGVHVPQPG